VEAALLKGVNASSKKRGSTREWSLMKVVAVAREEDTPLPVEHQVQGGGKDPILGVAKQRPREEERCVVSATS